MTWPDVFFSLGAMAVGVVFTIFVAFVSALVCRVINGVCERHRILPRDGYYAVERRECSWRFPFVRWRIVVLRRNYIDAVKFKDWADGK